MAESLGTVSATLKQSIARVELFTDATLPADDWRLSIHFEDGLYDSNGVLLEPTRFGTRTVTRRFGDIKSDPEIVALVTAIKAKAYAYRQEDIAATL